MKKVNITIGRFQPFTNGHLKCAEAAYKEFGVSTIVCMINVKDEKVDTKHPFPSSLILPLYNDAFKNNNLIEKFVLVANADIVKIGEMLYHQGYEIVSWSCGTDRINDYSKMASKYAEKAHLSPEFRMLEIKRSDEDVSATKVRHALLYNDKKTFDRMTPFGTLSQHLKGKDSIYEILKNQINLVMSKNDSLNESTTDIIDNCDAAYNELLPYKSKFDNNVWNKIETLTSAKETYNMYLCKSVKTSNYILKVITKLSYADKISYEINKLAKSYESQLILNEFNVIKKRYEDDYAEVVFTFNIATDISNAISVFADAINICSKHKAL